jgi:hypothetical protein
MLNISVEAGLVGAGATSCYDSFSAKMMRLLAAPGWFCIKQQSTTPVIYYFYFI